MTWRCQQDIKQRNAKLLSMSTEHAAGPFLVRHQHSISPQTPGGVHVSSIDIHDLEDEPVQYGAYGVANDLIGKIADGHTIEVKVVDHGRTTIVGRALRHWFLKPTSPYRYDENGIRRVVPCRTVSVPRPPWTHEPEITPDPADEPVRFSAMNTWELDCLRSSAEGLLERADSITDNSLEDSTAHAVNAISHLTGEARSLLASVDEELARRHTDER